MTSVTSRESFSYPAIAKLHGSDAVCGAAKVASSYAESVQLENDDRSRLCIIVEELVANLYEHGGLSEFDIVELSLGSELDGIRVRITDQGTPFDPRTARPGPTPTRGGGAGIKLVRSWAKLITYDVTSEGNRLELMLPIDWQR